MLPTSSLLLRVILVMTLHAAPAEAEVSPKPPSYTNPIIDGVTLADPHVVRHGDVYYLYPTSDGAGYHVYTSKDLVDWERRGRCFKASRGGAWAPDVFHNERGDGKFYLYYTVDGPGRIKQIGVAVADNPLGPFEDQGVLIERAIDAHLFQDTDGRFYLYYTWLHHGNHIRVQPMADPLHKEGESKPAVSPTDPWETMDGRVTEAPWMLKREGTYYLMYSGSNANSVHYAIGYATSDSPVGPFVKFPGNPIAKRSETVFGPGHHCVVKGPDDNLWMVYHQKQVPKKSWDRFLAIDPIWFDAEGVIHAKTTRGPTQPSSQESEQEKR